MFKKNEHPQFFNWAMMVEIFRICFIIVFIFLIIELVFLIIELMVICYCAHTYDFREVNDPQEIPS